jgi:hypothetical protein
MSYMKKAWGLEDFTVGGLKDSTVGGLKNSN